MRVSTIPDRELARAQGKHFYQFFKGPEDLFRTVIPFLTSGLKSGSACFWSVSNSVGVLEAVQVFQRQLDLLPFLDSGQLVISAAERWYLDRGRFSERKILQNFEKFVEQAKRRGFKTFRCAGDIGWLEGRDWVKFQAYEAKIHEQIQALQQIVCLCAYPIHRCSLTQTKDVLEHHDGVFLTKL